ncbi:MAG: 2OG-Fe(II) oxygenase, partial [Proteobacteria bacterium]|nr:2OG-Fe(II) oxygenase [Pseudomonadota bacterium]
MDQMIELNAVGRQFLACLNASRRETKPFRYWLLTSPLPMATVDAIAGLPYDPPHEVVFNGRRET